MSTADFEVEKWMAGFRALDDAGQRAVTRHIIYHSIGRLDEMMPDATPEEKQAIAKIADKNAGMRRSSYRLSEKRGFLIEKR